MVQQCSIAECAKCGKSQCSQCKKWFYCSAECQKKDWLAHKAECKRLKAEGGPCLAQISTARSNVQFPRIAIVDIPGKSKGVIAKEHISRGTPIVSEKPHIILPADDSKLPEAISRLSKEDISFILSFPGPENDPIRERFKHFMHCVDSAGCAARGHSETICRVNHTCHSPKWGPNATCVGTADPCL
ncbi:hypothetical protein B0H19DRAFT_81137 [Mycena capillaripes]|nr:hypothetical protein B0H19DRAFT_81137 [Mycena capillaripes]